MKSIKEKAKEYDRIVKCISPNQSIVDVSGRKLFEAGAYYVLDAIEEATNICFDEELKNVIQQLKK